MGDPNAETPMTNVGGISVFGATYPAHIWAAFMKAALAAVPPTDFIAPNETPVAARRTDRRAGPGLPFVLLHAEPDQHDAGDRSVGHHAGATRGDAHDLALRATGYGAPQAAAAPADHTGAPAGDDACHHTAQGTLTLT